jgi:hypothetical protein
MLSLIVLTLQYYERREFPLCNDELAETLRTLSDEDDGDVEDERPALRSSVLAAAAPLSTRPKPPPLKVNNRQLNGDALSSTDEILFYLFFLALFPP